jgi:asparagine synthase (glutamine-hydrolysing)
MQDCHGRFRIVFNGEIYNYLELRSELKDFPYCSKTDTEVVLAAYEKWGEGCLEKFIGMFAFLIWDEHELKLFAARDRFGVKPLYYYQSKSGALMIASEIKALHGAGVAGNPDITTWATYLSHGLQDHTEQTFWQDINSLPGGYSLTWQNGNTSIRRWYNLAERTGKEFDHRPVELIQEEYLSLAVESVRLRFRSDVPVGINLSGGLDSSTLLGLVQSAQGTDSDVKAFTYITGDAHYDELPWCQEMLARTKHPSIVCRLNPEEVPDLAESVQRYQDEPFGGLPTIAYAKVFERARAEGMIVLLDGQGMDEQWAGYDYYQAALLGKTAGVVQGTEETPVRTNSLLPEFSSHAQIFTAPQPFDDALRNLQYRDICYTKIPRALRFNDRVSMRASTELREPFLDHRLFELALRQPTERKIFNGAHKWLLRQMSKRLLPSGVVEAPKRPLSTPQREWLRGPLRDWADACIEKALSQYGDSWLDTGLVRASWQSYLNGKGDNSFFIWQWISLGMVVLQGANNLRGLSNSQVQFPR